FQFYKVITAGEGGLVATNNHEWIIRAGFQHDSAFKFWGEELQVESFSGENYRMSEINGALGYAQAHKLDSIVQRMNVSKKRIVAGIHNIDGLTLQRVVDPDGDCSTSVNFFLKDSKQAGLFSEALNAEGIPNGTVFN